MDSLKQSPEDANQALLSIQMDYSSNLIERVLAELGNSWDVVIGRDVKSCIDPVILFRQMQPALAGAEVSGLADSELVPLIAAYTHLVIGPAQLLDANIDGIIAPDISIRAFNNCSLDDQWALSAMMAAKGAELLSAIRPELCSRLIFPLVCQMYRCMRKQLLLSVPFSMDRLRNPASVVAEYDSPDSPEAASIFNRTMWFGALALRGWEERDIERTRVLATRFSYQRQRIDELADMFEDMMAGHITKPWAFAILTAENSTKAEIIRVIKEHFWSSSVQETVGEIQRTGRNEYLNWLASAEFVVRARDLLAATGVFDLLFGDLERENRLIQEEADKLLEQFPHDRLTRINELKRAYLFRIEKNEWLPHQAPDGPLENLRVSTFARR